MAKSTKEIGTEGRPISGIVLDIQSEVGTPAAGSAGSAGGKTGGTTPAEEKQNQKNVGVSRVRPSRAKSAQNKPDIALIATSSAMIKGSFMLTASMTKNAIWNVSDEEVLMIAEPLAAIIAEMGISESMAKFANPIALLMAVGTVVVPRVMITIAKESEPIEETAKPAPSSKPKSKSKKVSDPKPSNGTTGTATAPKESNGKHDGNTSWNLDPQ